MELLNITQRQMCESLAQKFIESSTAAEGICSFLAVLLAHGDVSDQLIMTKDELMSYGVINDQYGYGRCTVFDDGYETEYSDVASPIVFRAVDEEWIQEYDCDTIQDFLTQKGAATLLDYFGQPIMEKCHNAGSATIFNYCREHFTYNVTSTTSKFVLIYKGVEYQLAHFAFRDGVCYITPCMSTNMIDTIAELSGCFALCGQINALYGGMAEALAGNLCTPADLHAVLQKYVNSKWGAVRAIVSDLLRSGSSSVSEAVNNFIHLFRTMNDYTENDDGTLTWNTPGTKVNNSAWIVALQIATSVGQVIGYSLLMLGGLALKIVGGALVIASSIGQAIMNTLGQVSGTAPSICDEAIDDVYGDPIFQGHESIALTHISNAVETVKNLRDNGRAKIVTPWAVIFMYNATFDAGNLTADYKIFCRARTAYPNFWLGNLTHGSSYTGDLFSYAYNDPGINPTKRFAFYPSTGWSQGYAFANIAVRCSNLSNVVDITSVSGNAADADSWKNLWKAVCTNAIYTLCMCLSSVFCKHGNDFVRASNDDQSFCDDRYSSAIIDVLKGMNAIVYSNIDGSSSDIVNGIGALSAIDHADDNILFCALSTIGVLDLTSSYCYDELSGVEMPCEYNATSDSWGDDINLYTLSYSGSSPRYGYWYDGFYYALPFIAVDKYAYITPPSHSYTSVLWGAIIAAGVVALAVTAIYVTRAIIGKRVRFWMQRKGQTLLDQGSTFRNGFTTSEWDNLSAEDKATYSSAFRAYNFKVKLYNFAAGLLNLQSIDWINNWWNSADSVGAIPAVVAATQGSTIPDLLNTDTVKAVTVSGLTSLGFDMNQSFSGTDESISRLSTQIDNRANGTNDLVSDAIYLISGRHPS